MKGKLLLMAFVALLVAVVSGWLWGASGRSGLERGLRDAELKLELIQARSALLDARVSLFMQNFGDASRHLSAAKDAAAAARKRLDDRGETEAVQRVSTAMTRIEEAHALAGKLDQSAHNASGEAVKALDLVTRPR